MRYRVVLIEDNEGDRFFIQEALRLQAACEVTVIADGDGAFRYFESGEFGPTPPDLVVLDLNIPGKEGVEVLGLIRRNPETATIPVAVVSSSPADLLKQKAAQADCYITKPNDLDEYLAIGKTLIDCIRQ